MLYCKVIVTWEGWAMKEKDFLIKFLSDKAKQGGGIAYSELNRVVKEKFGKRVNIQEFVQVRRQLGLPIFFKAFGNDGLTKGL